MDCRNALEVLESVPARRLAAERAAFAEFHGHVQSCGLCRVAFDSRRLEDEALRTALHAVAIPPGLEGRIRDRLEGTVSRRRSVLQRLASVGSGVVAAGLLIGSGWLWWTSGRITLDDVRVAVNATVLSPDGRDVPDAEERGPTSAEVAVVADRDWRSLTAGREPRGLNVDRRPGADAAVYRFFDGRTQVRGILVVVPRRLVKSPPTNSIPGIVEYLPLPSSAWADDENVYLCIAQSGDLARLLRSMYGTTA